MREISMEVSAESLKPNWGWFLFFGVVLIILGTGAIILPGLAGLALEIILGWLFVIGGVFQIIHSFWSKKIGGFFLSILVGILYLAAGILLLAYPLGGLLTLTLVLAAFLMAEGVFRIIWSLQSRRHGAWGWMFFGGLISLTLGALIYMRWPSSSIWVIGLFLGIDFIFGGWAMVMAALAVRKAN